MDLSLDDVQDTDCYNVLQSLKDVEHELEASAATNKGEKGIRRRNNGLAEAAKGLREDMQRLLDSPHTQIQMLQPSALELDRSEIAAMRALWDVLQDLVKAPTEVATSKGSELRLRAAMIKAITAIDPSWTPPQKGAPEPVGEKGTGFSRYSRIYVCR
jgi:hypothetical protein